ncbi:MAG: hypothetical protein HKN79_03220 [Flavobacteriales bacterium]|nr:hypothetical protein [Flavobacteriales bacterium]
MSNSNPIRPLTMDKSIITQINERHFYSRLEKTTAEKLPSSELLDLKDGVLYLVVHTFKSWDCSYTSSIFKVMRTWLDEFNELKDAWRFHITVYEMTKQGRSEAVDHMEGAIIHDN